MLDDVKPIKEDLRVDRVLAHQFGVWRPHVHAYDLESMATPAAHFLGEELFHRLFSAVFSHPQQDPPLQIVNHRKVDLSLAPAHLIHADDMHRWSLAMAQTISDRPFHNRRHALPVEPIMTRRSLPTHLPSQYRYRVRQRRGRPGPRLRPGKVLHPQAAPGA